MEQIRKYILVQTDTFEAVYNHRISNSLMDLFEAK